MAASEVELPGPPGTVRTFGDYELLAEIGRSGEGVVYRARQRSLNRIVALKMISPHALSRSADLERFRREAEEATHLHHPNIVQIYAVGDTGNQPWLAMEFLAGGTLAEKLHGGRLPPREAAALVATLARAIEAAHERGIVHRDLKPANILFQSGDVRYPAVASELYPKIADMGIARLGSTGGYGEGALTAPGVLLGTASYMSPEQAASGRPDMGPATDIYSLGAILYECLTGRPPFQGPTPIETIHQVVSQKPVPPRRLNDKVSRDLEAICLKCLKKEPTRRYSSAKDLADELDRWAQGQSVNAVRPGLLERGWRWTKRLFGRNAQVPPDQGESVEVSEETSSRTEDGLKKIAAWISDNSDAGPLQVNQEYTLNLRVGGPVKDSLITDPAADNLTSDVPVEGLETSWVVSSHNVELKLPPRSSVVVTRQSVRNQDMWIARFSLHVPRTGNSQVRQLKIIPRSAEEARLEVMILVRGDIYRQFTIELSR
jgi:serine/threonine protein kinase